MDNEFGVIGVVLARRIWREEKKDAWNVYCETNTSIRIEMWK